jgi:plasmid maintenance system antidote protein VapI
MLLKEYLEKYGISKTAFAKRIGKSRELVHMIVNKDHIPKVDVAVKIEEITEGKVKKEEILFPCERTS